MNHYTNFVKAFCVTFFILCGQVSAQQNIGTVVNGTIFPGIQNYKNYINNPSARVNATQSTATSSATLTRDTTSGYKIDGVASFICNTSSNGGYCEWNTYTINDDDAMATKNCQASIIYKGDASLYQLQVTDGSSVIATGETLVNQADWSATNINYPCGATRKIRFTQTTAGTSAAVNVGKIYWGPAYNIGSVSQAEFWGSQAIAGGTNCYFSGTNSSTYNNLPTDADCSSPVLVGNATTAAGKIPGVSFASLPPGRYRVVAQFINDFSTADLACGARISDGTTGGPATRSAPGGSAGNAQVDRQVEGMFEYSTSQGAKTFQVQTATLSGSGTCDVANQLGGDRLEVTVYRYPLGSQTVLNTEQSPNSWSGFHAQSDCSWARTSATLGDPTADAACTFTELTNKNFGTVTSALSGSDKLPGITWIPKKAGSYHVCAIFQASTSDANQSVYMSLTDGTNIVAQQNWDAQAAGGYKFPSSLCGIYNATDTSAKTLKIQTAVGTGSVSINASAGNSRAISWSIFALDQGFPAGLILNFEPRYEFTSTTGSTSTSSTGFASVSGLSFTFNFRDKPVYCSWILSAFTAASGVYGQAALFYSGSQRGGTIRNMALNGAAGGNALNFSGSVLLRPTTDFTINTSATVDVRWHTSNGSFAITDSGYGRHLECHEIK